MNIHIHIVTCYRTQLADTLAWCEKMGSKKEIEDISLSTDGFISFKNDEEVKE